MNIELYLATVQAVCQMVVEILKFLQTPEGQASLKEAREDRAAFKAGAQTVGQWFQDLFSGKFLPQQ